MSNKLIYDSVVLNKVKEKRIDDLFLLAVGLRFDENEELADEKKYLRRSVVNVLMQVQEDASKEQLLKVYDMLA